MLNFQLEVNGARDPLVTAQGAPTLQPENSPLKHFLSLGEVEVPPGFQDGQMRALGLCN